MNTDHLHPLESTG